MSRTLIRNGTVHLEDRSLVTDVLVEDGLVADIGRYGHEVGDCETIDAKGLHVMPGLIDIHTHLDDTIGGYRLADTWATGSEIAMRNGITTLCGFVTQRPGTTLRESADSAMAGAEGHSHCDYSFHLTPTSFGREDWACIEKLLSDGFRTFKFYTTYRQAGLYLGYDGLGDVMRRLSDMGMATLVHCEDDSTLTEAASKVTDKAGPYGHALSRPAQAELEAIRRVLEITGKTKCRTHIVHVSTPEGAVLIERARHDLPLTCETCPQYLWLSEEKLKEPDGHRFICSPPLRTEEDRAEMRGLALQGAFDAYASDHCAFTRCDKDGNRDDYSKVPNGLPGIGALVPMIHDLHRDPAALARRLALNPARIAGLYPRKGAIRKGSDADLAIFEADGPEEPVRSSLADVYEPYAEKSTRLLAKYVLLRGRLAAKDGESPVGLKHTGKRV